MNRSEAWARLEAPLDVVVVGGGASGLGAALEAASRGWKVALFEARDFAQGTSSRSTKLVHGGVRYLSQGDLGLVREALRERGRLLQNAPHVVGDLAFLVPAYDWWAGPYYGVGLKLYDVLAGKHRFGRSAFVDRDQMVERLPTIETEGLRGGIVYHDGQFDDARLAMSLAHTAWDQGAVLLNHAPVEKLLEAGDRVAGVVVRDVITGNVHEVRAKVVINATGVWTDALRRMDQQDAPEMVTPSQGVHIVLDRSFLPGDDALMVPRTDDGRVLFAIPWMGRTLVGTTDTPVDEVSVEPRPLEEEVQFLLEHAGRYLSKDPTREDVLSVFAGLRPLVRPPKENGTATKKISRDHTVLVSRRGLVTVVGGKWTTYRKMGEDTVDRAEAAAGLESRPSITADLPLHGAPPTTELPTGPLGGRGSPLAIYGTDAAGIQALIIRRPELAAVLHPRLPYLAAEIVWAVREELARTLDDVLSRRTRALFLDARASMEIAPRVAELMAAELRLDAAWQRAEVERFLTHARGYLLGPAPKPALAAAQGT